MFNEEQRGLQVIAKRLRYRDNGRHIKSGDAAAGIEFELAAATLNYLPRFEPFGSEGFVYAIRARFSGGWAAFSSGAGELLFVADSAVS